MLTGVEPATILAVEDDAKIEVRKHTGVVQCQRFREALLRLIDAAEVGQ